MTREERIVETLVELSNTMADHFDVFELLHRLVERSLELMECTEVGLLLANVDGDLQVMASSSECSETLNLLQSRNQEGPCFDCYHGSTPVFSGNLRAARERWPIFAPAAVQNGINSVHAIPMRVHGRTIGALNLFRNSIGLLAARDVLLGQGMADIAAVTLVQERAMRESRGVVQQLQSALNSRVVIEQAKGVLAERLKVSVDVAFANIRDYARAHNSRLVDVAREVIDGRLDAAALAKLSPERNVQAR